MKNYKKTMTMLLTAAVLLIAVFMTGCTKLSEAPNSPPSEVDAPAESDGFGVYIKLERDDASSIALHGGSSFTKVCENADGSLLKAGEWIFTGDDIVQLSKEENTPVLFTVSAHDATSTWLAAKNNDLVDCLKKLELVDDAYQKLLTDEARELLDSAGCEDVEITWGSDPVKPVEAIMQTAGLRK